MKSERDILAQLGKLPKGWNFWTCCGIGSAGSSDLLCCSACGWQAEVSAWRPKDCPRCGRSLETD